MKWRDIKEDGRIVKGVNTTVDVGPGEIKTQAAKFGNKVDKDGRPPTLSKKVKGKSTNVLYNLGLAESKQSCPRTRAHLCQCESLSQVTEGSETAVIAQSTLEHSDTVQGLVLLIQDPAGGPTLIKGTIRGLEPGEHGFHIHEYGDLSQGCESAGGHYNPDGVDHGNLENGHVGDLGNITANEEGVAEFTIKAERVDLVGERSVVGRAIVVHADVDDLGKGGDAESRKTGNAGDRLACGVIVLRNEKVEENFADGKKKGSIEEGRKPNTSGYKLVKKSDRVELYINEKDPTLVTAILDDGAWDGSKMDNNDGWEFEKRRTSGPYGYFHVNDLKDLFKSNFNENFADGKVKGKSRPGRVKRAGASCNGSVTSLRKRAKNSSGEKAKMYHWCANMKSGKKK